MIALGTLTLLEHPDQLAKLKADFGLAPSAVEELLRFISPGDLATSRVALEDIEVGGVTIPAGQGMILLGASANRDPAAFPEPDRLDIERGARHHVAFGHGVHHCIGAEIARVELAIVLESLFRRIPDLRLAKPWNELRYKDGNVMYGVYEMPVTW
jgi:cytochrome P450